MRPSSEKPIKDYERAVEMAQQGQVLVSKQDNLSSGPGTHMLEREPAP